jgi:hypothetical protein
MTLDIDSLQIEIRKALNFSEQDKVVKAINTLRKIDSSNINNILYLEHIRFKILTLIAVQYLKSNDYTRAVIELAKCQPAANHTLPDEVILRWVNCRFRDINRDVKSKLIKFKNIHVYQIAYSEETTNKIYENINILDNTKNIRDDWREYWPIRSFFLENSIRDNDYYCFLSPKFKDKTGITEEEFYGFVNDNLNNKDLIDFSPFYDQKVLYKNIFEQGDWHHPGLMDLVKAFSNKNNICYDYEGYKDANTFIFCNYFLAKGWIWKKLFQICELIFNEAEENRTDLGKMLNSLTTYGKQQLPMKVFVIERVISLLIERCRLKMAHYPAMKNFVSGFFSEDKFEKLLLLDVDREVYIRNKYHAHITRYEDGRENLIKEVLEAEKIHKSIDY